MANEEHLKFLKKGAEAWNDWRVSNPAIFPDLEEASLDGAKLAHYDLTMADLRGANLSGANLKGAHFSHCDLDGAELGNASLVYATFYKTFLRNANLEGVRLGGARFRETVLTGANLQGTYLDTVVFAEVDLAEANLWEARVSRTVFCNTDLSKAKGLDGCIHEWPSSIDTHTLMKSDSVPIGFLRGCGLPDQLIDYMPSLTGDAIQFYSCFISYSRADKSFARRIHDQLQGRGIRCWLDEHQILPGDNVAKEIDTGIRIWDKVLLCCSESSLKSPWVNREMEKAIQKEERLWKERGCETLAIIPINLDGSLFGWDGHWKSEMVRRHAADFTGWEKDNDRFEKQFERVVKALRADEGARDRPPMPKL